MPPKKVVVDKGPSKKNEQKKKEKVIEVRRNPKTTILPYTYFELWGKILGYPYVKWRG